MFQVIPEGIISQEFIAVATFHILAAMSPGPDFAIVCRNSISFGRRLGLATAVGIALGLSVHILYCLVGIGVIISQSILLFNVMKLAAAGYLVWIGFKALRSKASDLQSFQSTKERLSAWGGFRDGFLTNVLNPKAALFFLALFTVSVSHETTVMTKIFYGVWMIFATMIWFGCVAVFFSNSRVRGVFSRIGHWFDRIMGGLLIALGVKIATVSNAR